MNRPAARWVLVAGWAGTLFALSAQSNLPTPPVPGFDKFEHAGAYGLLAFLLARAWFPSLRPRPATHRWALVVLVTFLYGVFDEVHQAFVPSRSCDPWDAVADLSGAVLCAAIVGGLMRNTRWPARVGLE